VTGATLGRAQKNVPPLAWLRCQGTFTHILGFPSPHKIVVSIGEKFQIGIENQADHEHPGGDRA
jgi:hypothetical protein